MPKFLTLDDVDPAGKTALVRCDLNVPVQDGKVSDATRIERLVPTLDELARKGARVVAMSHFGRPKDKEPELSLRQLVPALSQALGGKAVSFAADCVGPEAKRTVDDLKPGGVALLENLRFHKEEEANDRGFAQALASLGDLYVDDAFSAAHRAHASTEAIAHLMPAVAGRLMQAELEALAAALETPERPVMAIVGGAKVSTKLDMLKFILGRVDVLAIGGAMANTLLAAEGVEVGASLVERDMAASAKSLIAAAKAAKKELVLPVDAVVAPRLAAGVATEIVPVERIAKNRMILDIGPESVALVAQRLERCRTLVWNGPVGAFETKPFDKGTIALARKAAELTRSGRLKSVAGGGDTVAALAAAGITDALSYVSTAGGALLEWLEGRDLPGVAALAAAARR
jgi:phosphoglycerate kinase